MPWTWHQNTSWKRCCSHLVLQQIPSPCLHSGLVATQAHRTPRDASAALHYVYDAQNSFVSLMIRNKEMSVFRVMNGENTA